MDLTAKPGDLFRDCDLQKCALILFRAENDFYGCTYLLTYSMVQSPSWEANWFAASQEIPHISRNHIPPPGDPS